ncbi:RimJ/RimL family protein N-acetyltransferase [Natronocella acetinitrilica]|uniref:RimJ/RimL family protein N-acetyltransferase n=1 Tax=Natronocella acetinitrilica TaxID=414046 RepID=A0AAE3G2I6_9GAMM|nr:GNAT family N-acetyltransferase [Natronocella acetinitrilica]MCP1674596.1 RimJ/RimL family protein N-acetyltransferase [Natronocella acetinitrilica]
MEALESPRLPLGRLVRLDGADAPDVAAHYRRLDAAARYCRFAGVVPDALLERLAAEATHPAHRCFGVVIDGVLRGVAECRLGSPVAGAPAEVALSIESAWQGQGLGGVLLGALIPEARVAGARSVHLSALAANAAMLRLARRYGMTLTRDGEIEAVLSLSPPEAVAVPVRAPAAKSMPAPAA